MKEELKHIRQFPLFAKIDASSLDQLAQVRSIELGVNTMIFSEGDYCPGLAVVLQGQVRVFKQSAGGRELTLYRVNPGESCLLTTHCLLTDSPFCAVARVSEGVRALLIPADQFKQWFGTSPFWQSYVFQLMGQRLATLMELIQQVAFWRVDSRLIRFLHDAPDDLIQMTHQQLAEEIGSSREVVSRVLEDLAYREFIEMGRGRLIISDRSGLAKLLVSD